MIRRYFKNMKRIHHEKGFTLVEILLATCILSVGLLAVASLQAAAIRGNYFADKVSNGSAWAADTMEKLIATAYEDYNDANLLDTDGDGDGGLEDATATDADYQQTQGDYTIYWNISDNAVLNNTKTICVIVTWDDHGVVKQVVMQHVVPRMS